MRRRVLGLVVLALLMFVPMMVHAATAGKFTSVEGSVDVTSPGKEARPVKVGDVVNVGDIIRTKSKSKCEVEFPDGSVMRLAESSRLRVNEFSQDKGERNATLELFRGKIQNVVTAVAGGGASQSKYEIRTETAVCGVRGTTFFVYHQAGVTGAAFKEGTGYGYSRNRPGDVRPIHAGQAMTVTNPNVPPVVRPATALEMNQHQKDTAPAEKPKSDAKKDEEKKPESTTAKAEEGKKEEAKKDEPKKEEVKKEEAKAGETKVAESSTPAEKAADSSSGVGDKAASETTTASSSQPKVEETQKTVPAALPATATEQSRPADMVGKTIQTFVETSQTPVMQAPASTPSQTFIVSSATTSTTTTTNTVVTNPVVVPLIDTTPPEINLDLSVLAGASTGKAVYLLPLSVQKNADGSRDVSFVLSTGEPTSFSYSKTYISSDGTITSGSLSTPSQMSTSYSFIIGNLMDGYHRFKIVGRDGMGNETAFEFTLSGDALDQIASAGATVKITGLGASENSMKTIHITDKNGNDLKPESVPWVADITKTAAMQVMTVFSTKPEAISNVSSPSFVAVSTASGLSYSYSIDGSGYTSATGSTVALSGLSEGNHTLTVRATDSGGKVASESSYTWTTDYTKPTITFSGTPAAITNVNSGNIVVSTTDSTAVTTTYTLDGAVVSSSNLTGLAEGTHTFTVTATDAAGNVSEPYSYTWTTDYTKPTITITGTPAAITNVNSANIVVATADSVAVTTTYTLDGAVVSSPNLTGLAEGAHTFTVTATDAAGNVSEPYSYTWTTDYTKPGITVAQKASPAADAKSDIKLVLTGTESANFSTTLDGGAPVAGAEVDLKGLASGSHDITVQATDQAGNVTNQSFSFDLSRYSLTGNFFGSFGNASGAATGEVAGVSGESWGGWTMAMQGTGNATPSSTWTLSAGGGNTTDGYWLNVTPGTTDFTAKTLTGNSQLTYLSKDILGSGTGSVTGQFDGLGAYTLADVGSSYTQKPLTFMSEISSYLMVQAHNYWGSHSYANGEYTYNYYTDNHYGYASYWRTDSGITSYYIYYYSDGTWTKYKYSYDVTTGYTHTGTETGTWDTSQGLSFIATAEDVANVISSSSDNYPYPYHDGDLNALLGGTDSLWTATQATPAKITLMGTYSATSSAPHIWGGDYYGGESYYGYGGNVASYNYKNDTYTTYDGGAYKGFLTGTEIGNAMDARLIALYIDPSGNAGYLKGSLAGTAYPEIGMFAMDGSAYPTQVVSNIGIAPVDMNSSVAYNYYYYYNDTSLAGSFDTGGKITSDHDYYYYYYGNGIQTMSLVNYETSKAEPWGIYSLWLAGSYEAPATASTSWTAKAGGQGYFGAYFAGDSEAPYIEYDYGYWLADITSGKAEGNKLTGALSGRFITLTKMGTINGDLLGTYNTTNAWQAVSLGTWEGTPLLFGGVVSGSFHKYSGESSSIITIGSLNSMTDVFGLWGGTDDYSWNGTPVLAIGTHDNAYGYPLFIADLDGSSPVGSGKTKSFVFAGGRVADGSIASDSVGFYTRDNGANSEVGLLAFSPVSGSAISGTGASGVWQLSGSVYAVKMDDISTDTVGFKQFTISGYFDGSLSPGNPIFNEYNGGANIRLISSFVRGSSLTSQDWGIWQMIAGGAHPYDESTIPTTAVNTAWTIDSYVPAVDSLPSVDTTLFKLTETVWDKTGKTIDGQAAMAFADWTEAKTYVGGGSIKGVFDPSSVKTWQSVTTGAWMETAKFLQMQEGATTTETASDALKALNIPAVQVGKATLGYAGPAVNNFTSVTMADVTFFATSTGGAPKIWATNNVSGSFSGTPIVAGQPGYQGVTLTGGGGLAADFGIKNWNTTTGKWGAAITGNAPANSLTGATGYTQTNAVNFKGGAAGAINSTAGTISGTAAGIAK